MKAILLTVIFLALWFLGVDIGLLIILALLYYVFSPLIDKLFDAYFKLIASI